MRRVVAIAALLLSALPAPVWRLASAHEEHLDSKWRAPAEGADVSGESVRIRTRVRFQEGVDRWAVDVLAPEGSAARDFGTVCEGSGGGEQSVEISCDWDTIADAGGISWNGPYRLKVTAWNTRAAPAPRTERAPPGGDEPGDEPGGGGPDTDENEQEPRAAGDQEKPGEPAPQEPPPSPPAAEAHAGPERVVTVVNPPADPQGIQLSYSEGTGRVSLRWEPNREPDLVGYLVEERFESGDWSLVAKPATTSWSARPAKKGEYRYRVAAVRRVGSSGRVKEGSFREPQSGTSKVEADPDDARRHAESGPPEGTSAGGSRHGQATEPGSTTSTSPPDVGSVTVTFDGSGADPPAGDPAVPGTGPPAADPPGTAAPPPSVTAIQPGAPGSVETRYADPLVLPAPISPEEAYDPGFSLALPYPEEVRLEMQPPPEPPRILGTVVLFETDEAQQRALVGALAGGLVLFIASMQLVYVNRRPRLPELATLGDWD